MNSRKVTARPCKEHPNQWEIQKPDGSVCKKHYSSKNECVEAANELAIECGCECSVENHPKQNNTSK